ncbi:transglutaminase domain-containing protein [Kitasatospora sp. NPDC101801]|uniref:transglutaminase domain-containing protein n=1 Tax=Kitasatospora sp. NPDC101801 TaxID=3364103 RepID=UPI0038067AE3
MTTPAEGPSPARIIAPLLRIPDSHRVFRLPLAALEKGYGMTPPIVDELIAAGLRYRPTADGPLFDEDDVASVSLYLRLPSARRGVMTFWLRALRRFASADAPPAHRVEVTVGCPDPGHPGPCRYTVDLGGERPGDTFEAAPGAPAVLTALTTRAVGRPRELPPVLRELADSFADVDYYLLPGGSAAEPGLMQRTGIGDCILMAHAIVAEARTRGIEARLAGGLIVAVPFSSTHTWAECRVDGEWLPVDPLLPKALAAWGVPGAEQWPTTLAPVGLFHRLGGAPLRPVTHLGTDCGSSLRTREAEAA